MCNQATETHLCGSSAAFAATSNELLRFCSDCFISLLRTLAELNIDKQSLPPIDQFKLSNNTTYALVLTLGAKHIVRSVPSILVAIHNYIAELLQYAETVGMVRFRVSQTAAVLPS